MTENSAVSYIETMFNLPEFYTLQKTVNTPISALDYYNLQFRADNSLDLNITVEESGRILEYENKKRVRKEPIIFSYDYCKQAAISFLDIFAKLYDNNLIYAYDRFNQENNTYTFYFNVYHDNIPILGETVSLNISPVTGEVIYFSGISTYLGAYLKEDIIVSKDEAYSKYKENLGIGLCYKIETDPITKAREAIPMFGILPDGKIGISPSSGEVVKLNNSNVPDESGLRYGYEQSIIFASRYIFNVYGHTNIELLKSESYFLDGMYHMKFLRTEYGAPVLNNFITISIDADTGVTQNHEIVWDNYVDFENVERYIAQPHHLANNFFGATDFNLYYKNIYTNRRIPIYTTNLDSVFIDVKTRQIIN
ncbi:hypothetical protein AN641_05785 [Candidatus Epulonipiscioides gigas]|nr:hypothetical protein AN641_05785 [Epulopiscium sp. SCG-C07WGA-EpuloA2]